MLSDWSTHLLVLAFVFVWAAVLIRCGKRRER